MGRKLKIKSINKTHKLVAMTTSLYAWTCSRVVHYNQDWIAHLEALYIRGTVQTIYSTNSFTVHEKITCIQWVIKNNKLIKC